MQLQPCRFCGEVEWLKVMTSFDERCLQRPDGPLVFGPDGLPEIEEVDFVECLICMAAAPADVWNGTNLPTPEQRAAWIAYAQTPEAQG